MSAALLNRLPPDSRARFDAIMDCARDEVRDLVRQRQAEMEREAEEIFDGARREALKLLADLPDMGAMARRRARNRRGQAVTALTIVQHVADETGISLAVMRHSQTASARAARDRAIAAVAKTFPKMKSDEIGGLFRISPKLVETVLRRASRGRNV